MFMRVAVPEFGAFSMALARVGMAAIIMLGIVAALRQSIHFRARWKTYVAIGAINTALPFIAYSFAAKHIPAGYSAIANSTRRSVALSSFCGSEKLCSCSWLMVRRG